MSKEIGDIYLSPLGSDEFEGSLDYPVKTFEEAKKRITRIREKSGWDIPLTIILRGGRYELTSPWEIGSSERGAPSSQNPKIGRQTNSFVTFKAYDNETPVISGGRLIEDLTESQWKGQRLWTTVIPQVKNGSWSFKQVWVNNERRHRPRLPKKGFYHVHSLAREIENPSWNSGDDRFHFEGEQFKENWHNPNDVEVCLFNYWIDSRLNVKSIDDKDKLVTLQEKTGTYLMSARGEVKGAPYWIENVFDELQEPEEWYLDNKTGQFYYLPLPGETLDEAEIIAPVLDKLLIIEGEDLEENPAVCIRFKGLTFSHTHIDYPIEKKDKEQAASNVPGVITISKARKIIFDECSITHVGNYGVNFTEKTRDIAIRGSVLSDLGAGGVRIWHGCHRTEVSDCTIADGGHIYHRAVGVLIGQASGNRVIHNHIHNFDYTGVSAGWCWGYHESGAYGNIIEHNHIHHIGHGRLSDMGGIYLLGVSTGTRLRYNLIHNVESRHYGGWGIYTDEGSSYVLIENNVVHSCQGSFDQHYGEENLIRNNIFCLGSETQMRRLRPEDHSSFTFTGNIVYFREGTVWAGETPGKGARINGNFYYDPQRKTHDFGGKSFMEWQNEGQDRDSLFIDPRLKNPEEGDFTIHPDSPVIDRGFIPFSLTDAGPRPVSGRERLTPEQRVGELTFKKLPIG